MRILFIRHGEPDYANDTLTEKGHREAALLAESAERLHPGTCYVSPLGRARHTADYTLKKLGLQAEVLDWLEEVPAKVDVNQSEELLKAYPNTRKNGDRFETHVAWDIVPSYWTEHPEYMDRELWRNTITAQYSDMIPVYDSVIRNFDEFLAEYGYVREGNHYRVVKESEETVTFFCHFGLTCVLLSRLWNVSPFVLWHGLVMAPTSVTEVVSEEREQGIAYFRGLKIGDVSHLIMGGEEPSFAARFCEVYSNTEQRH